MTTSILDAEDLLKKLTGEKAISPLAQADEVPSEGPVSGQELINRVKELFTPEEAEALARRIEEGRDPLVTRDQHFRRISQLKLVEY